MYMMFLTHFRKNKRIKITPCAVIILLAITASAGLSLKLFAQGGGREPDPKPATHTKIRTRRIVKRPATAKAKNTVVSLLILTTPPNSKISINNEPKGETDSNGELEVSLPPAIYTISISRAGYVPEQEPVEVDASSDQQQIEFSLKPDLITLNIQTDPTEAEVYLDDAYKGTSNSRGLLVIEAVVGSLPHTLRAKKAGYGELTMPVSPSREPVILKLLASSIVLKIVTTPPETEVYFDDVYKGTSTANGILMIDQVNPNDSHKVRTKKSGYLQKTVTIDPNSAETVIILDVDPVVVLTNSVKDDLATGKTAEALGAYNQLVQIAPNDADLPGLSESILKALQNRSNEMLKHVEAFGVFVEAHDALEMRDLYEQARKLGPYDESMGTLAKYWEMKTWLTADVPTTERENLKANLRACVSDLSSRKIDNVSILLDLGWTCWKLRDEVGAKKYFDRLQSLNPDWAYPYLAQGFMQMTMAEREGDKSEKAQREFNYDHAIENFSKAVSLKNDFVKAYQLRCIAMAEAKRGEAAVESGLQAVTLAPNSAYSHFALGFAYCQSGKSGFRNASNELNIALSMSPSDLDESAKISIQQCLAQIAKALK